MRLTMGLHVGNGQNRRTTTAAALRSRLPVPLSHEFRPIVAHVPDVWVGFEHHHVVGVQWPQQIEREPFGFVAVEPSVELAWVEDDGHSGQTRLMSLLASVVTTAEGGSKRARGTVPLAKPVADRECRP